MEVAERVEEQAEVVGQITVRGVQIQPLKKINLRSLWCADPASEIDQCEITVLGVQIQPLIKINVRSLCFV